MTRPNPARVQCINLDWVSFSLILALSDTERTRGVAKLATPQGYTLVECRTGTPQYKRRVLLLTHEGDKVATLLLQPYSNIIDTRSMFVEVANGYLYHPQGIGWMLDLLEQVHPFTFGSLSRIDVACDFAPDEEQRDIINQLTHNTAYVSGKREGARFHTYDRPAAGGRVEVRAKQIAWGSKYSAFGFKLYNKTLEITETDDKGRTWVTKPYIPMAWSRAGLTGAPVWRLEASLKGASTFDYRGQKMGWQMTDRDTAARWFYDTIATRFTIRANEGHACKKNDRELTLIDIPNTDHYRTRERVGEGDERHTDHAATLRMCIRELEREENRYSAPNREIWLNTIEQVLRTNNLHPYFYRTMGKTWEEYAAEVYQPMPDLLSE